MKGKTYSIKEVSKKLEVENHVLRFYEKELELDIHRNAQGHRIYTEPDITLLEKIIGLREQGLGIKGIRSILQGEEQPQEMGTLIQLAPKPVVVEEKVDKPEGFSFEDMGEGTVLRFMELMRGVFTDVFEEHAGQTKEQIKEELSEELSEEVNIMVNKKMRELQVIQAEKDEMYYARVDESMREVQRIRKEMAELMEKQGAEKVGFWKRIFGTTKKEKAHDTEEVSSIGEVNHSGQDLMQVLQTQGTEEESMVTLENTTYQEQQVKETAGGMCAF